VSVAEHKHHAPPAAQVRVAVVTVSDSRTEATDEGGRLVGELCAAAGFAVVSRIILRDEPAEVAAHVRTLALGPSEVGPVDAVLLTGGTGLSRRDSTVEALAGSFEKTIDGFGELFRLLSFQEIGSAAMLSRATAGTIGRSAVFLMPGSPAGVRLALERLILPELAHLVSQLNRGGAAAPGPHPAPAHEHHGSRQHR
jgi:molybdopterin adenylyltransferase